MGKEINEVIILTRIFLVILSIFGIYPIHSFSNFKLSRNCYDLIYTTLMVLCVIGVQVFIVIDRNIDVETYHIADELEFVLVQLTWIWAIIQSYEKRFLWQKFMKEILRPYYINNYQWSASKLLKCRMFYMLVLCIALHIFHVIMLNYHHGVSEIDFQLPTFIRNLICFRIVLIGKLI